MLEICQSAFEATAKFCVYIHMRPDGSPFYIGKGLRHRAFDFAPSRRTLWHRNIVAKHGRGNIKVKVIPCMTEDEALMLERTHIKLARGKGIELANLTNGGEGAAGRKASEKQLAGLAKGRQKGKKGVKGERPWLKAWREGPEGTAHLAKLALIGKENLHKLRHANCKECEIQFETRSAKAEFCSRNCGQRYHRAGKNKP